MTIDHDELRRLLGGYLLGGLDDGDTDRLDAHLLTCDDCRAELDRLAAVPELLRSLPRAESPAAVAPGARPSAARIEGLLGQMRLVTARERRRSLTRRLAVAAAVLLIVAISGGLIRSRDDAPAPNPRAAASPSQRIVVASFEAAEGSGLTGEAVLTGKTWGVSVDLAVQKLAGEGPFVCQVEGGEGSIEQAAMWGPTPSGNARVTGASSIQLGNVSVVLVKDKNGHVLGAAHLN
ncbi:zf-HC2 domain-containing protein [Actinoplanes sp. TFC3]|uniref:zf-HC2 domain-containing protein n=1 Tax=Actinoplanes sp. TFC3 TaxID=1710355 RepID=UPI00082C8754|nr:zf-HC2 domain-containing protein [Actinoplanes sp. TFC3]